MFTTHCQQGVYKRTLKLAFHTDAGFSGRKMANGAEASA
jgi:hypothetical protein